MLGGARRAELRDHQKELHNFQVRLAVSAGLVLVVFFLLLIRFFYVQVLQHDYYHTLAENNRISIVPIIPNRGLILDRNGAVLAHNYAAYTLEITPNKAGDAGQPDQRTGHRWWRSRPKDRKRFRKLLEEGHDFASLPIRTRLNDEEVARFAANKYRFPGVDIRARLFRHYPNGEVASHVHRLHRAPHPGRPGSAGGRRGRPPTTPARTSSARSAWRGATSADLHGTTGFEEVETDADGRAVRTLRSTLPVSGNNLLLSLDARLQEVAERVFGDRRGALVAIEPSTGGVLALVSKPGFDPNLFVDGIDPQNWEALNNSPDHPLNNRALQGVYPPGSTFKPFMAMAALELGKRTPHHTIFDPGLFRARRCGRPPLSRLEDRRPWHGRHAQVDRDFLRHLLLRPGAGAGHRQHPPVHRPVRLRQAHRHRHRRRGRRAAAVAGMEDASAFKQKWFAGDTISVGIGQGYNLATPMQLAQAVSILANNGVVFRPHIVRHIQNSQTNELTSIEVEPVGTVPLQPENRRTWCAMPWST